MLGSLAKKMHEVMNLFTATNRNYIRVIQMSLHSKEVK